MSEHTRNPRDTRRSSGVPPVARDGMFSRRTLAAGAAWTVPAVAFAVGAPAMAASTCLAPGNVTVVPADGIVTVTIPGGCPTIDYVIQGGAGSFLGGGGALNSGQLLRTDPSAPITLRLIAGAGGTSGNPQFTTFNTGGTGYGKGGDSTWVGFGTDPSTGAHSTAGAGGGGSAILAGTSGNTPLVVAGGGGGSAHYLGATSDGTMIEYRQVRGYGGSAAGPGQAANGANATASIWGINGGTGWKGIRDEPANRIQGGVGANAGSGGAAGYPGRTPFYDGNITTFRVFWKAGTSGQNHGAGLNGGGNGGSGNGSPPAVSDTVTGPTTGQAWAYHFTPGGSGGGGYAGGGGGGSTGTTGTPLNHSDQATIIIGTSGGAGSSFVSGALPAAGTTVTPVPGTWTSRPQTPGTGVPGENGYITLTWG